jgi:hypothetical protein
MANTTELWRLDVIAQGSRMAAAAMHELDDLNEARFVVHEVMLAAMTDMLGPVSRRQLDSALCRALRTRSAPAANDASEQRPRGQ